MISKKSILIIFFLIISLSCLAHAQTIYEWVDDHGYGHATTDYNKVPLKYRNQVEQQVEKPAEKPERAERAYTTSETQPEQEGVSQPVATRDVAETPYYFTLKLGIYSPESDELTNDTHFDTGWTGEISFGRHFHRNFAMELGVGYLETNGGDADLVAPDVYRADFEIRAIPLTLTAKGVLPLKNVDLFAAAGVGLYFVMAEADVTMFAVGNDSFDDDDTVFGFHGVIGANFNITQNIFIGLEGKYLWARPEFEGTILGQRWEFDADLDGFTITVNIGYRF